LFNTDADRAAIKIQAIFRAYKERKQFRLQRKAALTIQRNWKLFVDQETKKRMAILRDQAKQKELQRKKMEDKLIR
jgi:hypothetical protein